MVNRSNFDFERYKSAKKLQVNKNFKPCPVNENDELFQNGIFVFNITKVLAYLQKNSAKIDLFEVAVEDFPKSFSSIKESHLNSVDISQPVVLAEISPGYYNLIDGNHRVEKARRTGIKSIFAYKLNVKQHLKFLTEKKAYLSFVEYWNGKCK